MTTFFKMSSLLLLAILSQRVSCMPNMPRNEYHLSNSEFRDLAVNTRPRSQPRENTDNFVPNTRYNPNWDRNMNNNGNNDPNHFSYVRTSHSVSNGPVSGSMPGIDVQPSNMNENRRPIPLAVPVNPNQAINVKPAFSGCEKHNSKIINSKLVGSHYETAPAPMKHNSHIAFYPLTDSNEPMYLKIMMPSMQFKAKIDGSNVDLERCSPNGLQCHQEDSIATKSRPLLTSQDWNYIYCQMVDNKIIIGIGNKVEVMSVADIPAEDLEHAEWLVTSGEGDYDYDGGEGGGSFVVQYPCSEYVAKHLPTRKPVTHSETTEYPFAHRTDGTDGTDGTNGTDGTDDGPFNVTVTTPANIPHKYDTQHGYNNTGSTETSPPTGGSTTAIIVGVIVALLLVALVTAIAVSVSRRRNACKINESTPLDDKQTQATQAKQ